MEQNHKHKLVEDIPSPEELDIRLNIIRPWEWSIALCLTACTLFALGWGILGELSEEVHALGTVGIKDSRLWRIDAPTNGMVGNLSVKTDARVGKGEMLLELYSPLKAGRFQTTTLPSPGEGKVVGIFAEPGNHVRRGEPLIQVQGPGSAPQVLAYVPPKGRYKLHPGQEALVRFEYMAEMVTTKGKVVSVSPRAIARKRILRNGPDPRFASQLPKENFLYQAIIEVGSVIPSEIAAERGFVWRLAKQGTNLVMGTPVQVSITTRKYPPITVILPFVEKLR